MNWGMTRHTHYRRPGALEPPHRVLDHLEPWSHLHGKVVMVIGASSGLGCEFCLDLPKVGCRIIAVVHRIDRLQSVCASLSPPSTDLSPIAPFKSITTNIHIGRSASLEPPLQISCR
ncbi:hypothetical protein ACFX15_046217 [Malus domestica]